MPIVMIFFTHRFMKFFNAECSWDLIPTLWRSENFVAVLSIDKRRVGIQRITEIEKQTVVIYVNGSDLLQSRELQQNGQDSLLWSARRCLDKISHHKHRRALKQLGRMISEVESDVLSFSLKHVQNYFACKGGKATHKVVLYTITYFETSSIRLSEGNVGSIKL